MEKLTSTQDLAAIRGLAEKIMRQRGQPEAVAEADMQRLIHELQIHQIELELQNEALLQTQAENQAVMRQLADFNDRLEELVAVRTADLTTARDAAETASRAKSVFLATMSHELRTPMNAIIGMTDLSLRRATDPRLIDQLTKVKNASHHLLAIINDILDLSKIEADRVKLASIGFKLESLIANLHNMVACQAEQQGLTFRVTIAPDLAGRPLLGDPMHLMQILVNLVSNAIKFTSQGSVSLNIGCDEETEAAVTLHFEVVDTGVGIRPEDLERIFAPFEQADGSMTRQFGGTGLGLAISRRLARLMGGNLGVESTLGRGSTFRLTVPLGKATEADFVPPPLSTDSAETRIKSAYAGARILLVEDEPITQEVSLGLLETLGLAVDVANNGVEAVELARCNEYALILMDMQMPLLNGVGAARAIRDNSLNRITPILAMTANAFDEDRDACTAAGMNEHISKPVDPQVLYGILLRWLEKRSDSKLA